MKDNPNLFTIYGRNLDSKNVDFISNHYTKKDAINFGTWLSKTYTLPIYDKIT
jgi:hypothetical protein